MNKAARIAGRKELVKFLTLEAKVSRSLERLWNKVARKLKRRIKARKAK